MLDIDDIVFLSLLCVLPLGLASPTDSKISSCKDGGNVYKEGQSWSNLGECQQYTCVGPGEVTALGCVAMDVDESSGWKISKMDMTKMYPECCPQAVPPPSSGKQKGSKCNVPKKQADDTKKGTDGTKKDKKGNKKEGEAVIVVEAVV